MNVTKTITDDREEGGGELQLKPKRKLMTKFFNEPVDALDLRLAKAEENLSTLPADPLTDIKHEVLYNWTEYVKNMVFLVRVTFPWQQVLQILFQNWLNQSETILEL